MSASSDHAIWRNLYITIGVLVGVMFGLIIAANLIGN
jgi:hypothetical protein